MFPYLDFATFANFSSKRRQKEGVIGNVTVIAVHFLMIKLEQELFLSVKTLQKMEVENGVLQNSQQGVPAPCPAWVEIA